MHRFNTTEAIVQITHNDFAISEVLLNAYMEALGTTEIEIRVVARRYKKSLQLIREANYIQMLYQLTVMVIVKKLMAIVITSVILNKSKESNAQRMK